METTFAIIFYLTAYPWTPYWSTKDRNPEVEREVTEVEDVEEPEDADGEEGAVAEVDPVEDFKNLLVLRSYTK